MWCTQLARTKIKSLQIEEKKKCLELEKEIEKLSAEIKDKITESNEDENDEIVDVEDATES